MKKILFRSILGLAALFSGTLPSSGQGKLNLNNYTQSGNPILYGAGWGALTGAQIRNNTPNGVGTWSIGFYYALGDVTASVNPDPSGLGTPSGGGLALATGAVGDTTRISDIIPFGGYFASASDAIINGWTTGVITVEMVAYNGSDYQSSIYRGHSSAFLFTPIASTALQAAPSIGTSSGGMPSFAINLIPEPTTVALAGLSSALFLFVRHKRDKTEQ